MKLTYGTRTLDVKFWNDSTHEWSDDEKKSLNYDEEADSFRTDDIMVEELTWTIKPDKVDILCLDAESASHVYTLDEVEEDATHYALDVQDYISTYLDEHRKEVTI